MEWISVEDRLPKTGERVLIYVERKNTKENHHPFVIGRFAGKKTISRFFFVGQRADEKPTHWMYFPDPPTKEKNL